MKATSDEQLAVYGRVRQAMQRVRACHGGTPLHEHVDALAACARLFAAERACSSAEAYFEQALRLAAGLPAVDAEVELLCECAEIVAWSAEHERQRPRPQRNAARARALALAERAAALAPRLTCASVELRVLARLSALLWRCGRGEDASLLHEQLASRGGASSAD
jgi:hypothetical protein